ncbi:hypothetical protein [Qipengyuania marisflavi]|uniref:Uncharacterized protein n=1 Tax=Qipengyuania marisflavi TaxID=2486356 RepID=A0A5S3P9X3_9SPHN|nr:hypothetical protein [Qipengyuania marisflavi]TMM50251.1 hypothetical protein FEV51_03460 [Qipengyuania marisflavi]
MKWVLIFMIYAAPVDAVDWDGPWTFGSTHLVEEPFNSEAECRNEAVQAIGRIHQGMLAPVRYRCVQVEAGLPEGAPR